MGPNKYINVQNTVQCYGVYGTMFVRTAESVCLAKREMLMAFTE